MLFSDFHWLKNGIKRASLELAFSASLSKWLAQRSLLQTVTIEVVTLGVALGVALGVLKVERETLLSGNNVHNSVSSLS